MTRCDSSKNRIWLRIPPLGLLALAAFVICAITGVMLALVYRPDAPLDSLALLLLKNPAGAFVRSMHYWSAQGFLIFTLAHLVDHLFHRSEMEIPLGVWLRSSLTVPVIMGIMLSGFLLRADAAGVQALQVLRTLLGVVPLIGPALVRMLTGSGSDLFTIYLHHVCTATVVIWLVTIDHSRRMFPGTWAFLWMLPSVLLVSLLLAPGLEWRAAAVEKGPWYLVGLQEGLHWLQPPQMAVWLALAGLALLAFLPKFLPTQRTWIKRALLVAVLGYAVLTIIGLGFRGDGWRWELSAGTKSGGATFVSSITYAQPDQTLLNKAVPMVNGRREGCLACHQGMAGFSAPHDPQALGCAACHLGNPFTLNKTIAHTGMTRTPGNLSVVNQTCAAANCHGDIAARVRGSLMNTMSGVVAVDKFVFGESRDLDAHFDVAALKHSPADTHLRQLCASCHLGQDKSQPGPVDEASRGGGCSACHLRYPDSTQRFGTDKDVFQIKSSPSSVPNLWVSENVHPEISVNVPEQNCFGCHSRSGRIATSYEGWHETLLDESAAKTNAGGLAHFRALADGRAFEKHPADVHFEKGMTCIDCHLAAEIMGDGAVHAHERNAVKIACADCHAAGATPAKDFAELDAETQKIITLRKLNEPGRKFVISPSGSVAYPNIFLDTNGEPLLALKESGKLLKPKPAAAVCARAGLLHQRLDCGACHTAWAPQCVSCHTKFDAVAQGWDHLAGKFVNGAWQEEGSNYLGDAPALGVEQIESADGEKMERVTTFVPGMALNLELPADGTQATNQFHRLFAPASPHTTVTRARDCRSCHANPAALGYGRGELKYVATGDVGKWQFIPTFPPSRDDGLPLDAWIGFLREPPEGAVTRKNARPFSLREQQSILLVGACLQCHDEKEPRLAGVLADFKNYRAALGAGCRLPAWAAR